MPRKVFIYRIWWHVCLCLIWHSNSNASLSLSFSFTHMHSYKCDRSVHETTNWANERITRWHKIWKYKLRLSHSKWPFNRNYYLTYKQIISDEAGKCCATQMNGWSNFVRRDRETNRTKKRDGAIARCKAKSKPNLKLKADTNSFRHILFRLCQWHWWPMQACAQLRSLETEPKK